MLVARSHDLKMLESRLKNAKSTSERELIKFKISQIGREDKDPVVADLRFKLVNAARNGDNKAGDEISEQIYLHQLKTGKVKDNA